MAFCSFYRPLSVWIALFLPVCLPMAHAENGVVKDGVPRYVVTKLVPEYQGITPGQVLTIAIDQTMVPDWHTYWKNPGDSGEATSISWTLPKGWKNGDIQFPTPHLLPTGPLMNYGFSNHVTLLTTLVPPDKISEDQVTLTAEISWLVCADICVPEQTTATLTLPVMKKGESPEKPDSVLFEHARQAMPELVAWQGSVEEKAQSITLSFLTDDETIAALKGARDMYFYPEDWGLITYATPQTIAIEGDKLNITLQRDTRPLSEFASIRGVFTYAPADTAKEAPRKAVYIDVPLMGGAKGVPPIAKDMIVSVNADNISFIQALFLAFIGGLILNLMPCVFPVLSMKAISLIKMSSREQKHANIHGFCYTAGVLVCFVGIATLLILLQSAGEEIGWGFQLQNPTVILLLSYLLFVMALNLSGFFDFKSHFLSNIGHKLTTHHGYLGTFFTGMLATIVAAPCTAPFMGAAMGYALTQPTVTALGVFVALGLGLAFPYLLLCLVPALRTALPKPGSWMETFRQFMAFPLYASVAWLIWVFDQQVNGDSVLMGLGGLVLIAFSVWVSWHIPSRQPWKAVVRFFAFAAVALALLIAALSGIDKPAPLAGEQAATVDFPSTPYSADGFAKALSGNDPLFVDMTAAWCITCKVNEKMALSSQDTQTLFQKKNVQVFVGDWTNRSNEITEFLRSYGRSGVPLYVYIGPRDLGSGQRPEAKILPQLLTSGIIADAISNP